IPEKPQVAVVVEDGQFEAKAVQVLGALRKSGISAELFVTGNPKKRYDRALKAGPAMTICFGVWEGLQACRERVLRPDEVDQNAVRAALDPFDLGSATARS